MVAALMPYAVVMAVLVVVCLAWPLVGVLATAAALAVATAGQKRR